MVFIVVDPIWQLGPSGILKSWSGAVLPPLTSIFGPLYSPLRDTTENVLFESSHSFKGDAWSV